MSQSETRARLGCRISRRAPLLLAVALVMGCSDDDRPTGGYAGVPVPSGTTSGSASSGAGGQGGAGGTTSSGAGGGAGGAEPGPSNACDESVAFQATGMSFTEPAPVALAAALNRALFGYDAHGTSVVVHGAAATTWPTEPAPSGDHVLVGEPTFTTIVKDLGGFRSETPQDTGWLRLHDDHGAVDLEIHSVSVDARAGADCSQIFVVLDAIIPTEAGSVSLTLDGTTATIAELAGGAEPPTQGWPVRALFLGESIAFDFGSLSP